MPFMEGLLFAMYIKLLVHPSNIVCLASNQSVAQEHHVTILGPYKIGKNTLCMLPTNKECRTFLGDA